MLQINQVTSKAKEKRLNAFTNNMHSLINLKKGIRTWEKYVMQMCMLKYDLIGALKNQILVMSW